MTSPGTGTDNLFNSLNFFLSYRFKAAVLLSSSRSQILRLDDDLSDLLVLSFLSDILLEANLDCVLINYFATSDLGLDVGRIIIS